MAASWRCGIGEVHGQSRPARGRRRGAHRVQAAKQESVASRGEGTSKPSSTRRRDSEGAAPAGSRTLATRSDAEGGRQRGRRKERVVEEEEEEEEEERWVLKMDDDALDEEAGPASALAAPPAGFVLEDGEVVLMAPPGKRTLTLVDPDLGRSLDCLVRRTFIGSQGYRFFVLIPLDTPVQVLHIDNERGVVAELEDPEVEQVFPAASYALAKKSMHLVQTGFCLTARGALCYTEAAVINLETEYGLGILGNLGEGVEICKFTTKGREYIIYTPFDPLLFIAYQDEGGQIRLAESDELLSDPKVEAAVAEEQEFNNMVDEEEEIVEAIRAAGSRKS